MIVRVRLYASTCVPISLRTSSGVLQRNTSKNAKAAAAGLKKTYTSPTAAVAEEQLEELAKVWDAKYPPISQQWRAKWPDIISMFDFPEEIRRVTYTTHVIESLGQHDSQVHEEPDTADTKFRTGPSR